MRVAGEQGSICVSALSVKSRFYHLGADNVLAFRCKAVFVCTSAFDIEHCVCQI